MTVRVSLLVSTLLSLLQSVAIGEERSGGGHLFEPARYTEEPLPFGDMNRWVERNIHESLVLGGRHRKLAEVGPGPAPAENEPFVPIGGSHWGTSNIFARICGIVKTSQAVFPEQRAPGDFCARLETLKGKVRVLGVINISYLNTGTLFLGDVREPVSSVKEGRSFINHGIPFTRCPKAIKFDYKVSLVDSPDRIRDDGLSSDVVPGPDFAKCHVFLQARTEAPDGSIKAQRVATLVVHLDKSTDGWVNGAVFDIHYGDITGEPYYDARTMRLTSINYARNSRGESHLIEETGWAPPGTQPTHLMVQFNSSYDGAFVGTIGNKLWVDNVKLLY